MPAKPVVRRSRVMVPVTCWESEDHKLQNVTPAGTVPVEKLWVERPLPGGWMAAYWVIPRASGRLDLAEVRIFPNEDGRRDAGEWSGRFMGRRARLPQARLTARLMREATRLEVVRAVFAAVAQDHRAAFNVPKAVPKPASKGGRPPTLTQRDYAALAVQYDEIEQQRGGAQASTRQRLAEHFGVSLSTIVGRLAACRRQGLLARPEGTSGCRSFVATPLAEALVRRTRR